MGHKMYMTVSTIIFAVIALGHLLRVVLGWDVVVAGSVIPMWVSWAAFIVAGFLAYTGYKHQR